MFYLNTLLLQYFSYWNHGTLRTRVFTFAYNHPETHNYANIRQRGDSSVSFVWRRKNKETEKERERGDATYVVHSRNNSPVVDGKAFPVREHVGGRRECGSCNMSHNSTIPHTIFPWTLRREQTWNMCTRACTLLLFINTRSRWACRLLSKTKSRNANRSREYRDCTGFYSTTGDRQDRRNAWDEHVLFPFVTSIGRNMHGTTHSFPFRHDTLTLFFPFFPKLSMPP